MTTASRSIIREVAARRGPAGHRRAVGRPLRLATLALVSTLVAACGTSTTPSATPVAPPGAGASAAPAAPSAGASLSPGTARASAAPAADGSGSPSGSTGNAPSGAAFGAEALQAQFVSVIQKVNPSVVLIQTNVGLGSGIVFDTHGDIVTNAHVAGGATSFTVTLADGRSVSGKLVGEFVPNDIAVIRASASNLQPATFGDSSKLQVGDIVLAMGNPLGLQSSVTEGIVSALGRTVAEPNGAALPNVIQTSAAINPGNSGGALVDLAGDVVGIPTLAATDPQIGGAAAGIGFAIPSNVAKDLASQIIAYGKVINSHRAYLGIQSADLFAGGGALVYSVVPGGPAAKAGLRAGDIITAIDGQAITSAADLATALADLKPGQTVSVSITHPDGSQATVHVTLGQLPG